MNLPEHVAALLAKRKSGFALPGAFFTDEALYQAELEFIFGRHWLFLASEAEIPEGGDYRTYQIGHYPIFVLRRDDGSIAAFHNTCRHRGSRILQQDSGVAGATLMCPYHRWSYDLEGQVVGCGATGELPRAQPPLKPVHVKLLAGLIFVCVSDAPPPDFDDMAQRMAPYLAPHALTHTKVARQVDIIEHGSLKAPEALKAAFADHKIDLKTPIITTCGSGVTAAILALAVEEAGGKMEGLYDGSWAEWGSRADCPVVTGPE